jgi:hypothetical protein
MLAEHLSLPLCPPPPPLPDLPLDGEAPEQLLVHLALRGRGTLLAYSSHRPKVGQGPQLAERQRPQAACPAVVCRCSLPCLTARWGQLLVAAFRRSNTHRPPPPPRAAEPQACFVDGFEVQFEHQGDRLTVQVPQVGSLHAGRSEQRLVVAY